MLRSNARVFLFSCSLLLAILVLCLPLTGKAQSVPSSGTVKLGTAGTTPNASGATVSGRTLTLQAGDTTHPGLLQPFDMLWDAESSTTPRMGSLTLFSETGVTGAALSTDTSAGNALKFTQTSGGAASGSMVGAMTQTMVSADYRCKATFRLNQASLTNQGLRFMVGVRGSISGGVFTGYVLGYLANATNKDVDIYKAVGGAYTPIKTGANALTVILPNIAAGDNIDLELAMRGPRMWAYVNGILVWSFSDTSITAAGAGLVSAFPAPTGTQTVALVDRFSCTTLTQRGL